MTDIKQQLINRVRDQLSARTDDLIQLVLSAHFGSVPSIEHLRLEQVTLTSEQEGEARRYRVWRKELQIGTFRTWLAVEDGRVKIEFDGLEILPQPSVRKITVNPENFVCVDK